MYFAPRLLDEVTLFKVIVTGRTLKVGIELLDVSRSRYSFCPKVSKRRASWPMAVRGKAGGDSGVTAEPAGVRV